MLLPAVLLNRPHPPTVTTAPKLALGRPRGFDPDIALRSALDLFWRQGYGDTSLADLTRAMGLSRSSFYACFGSKHAVLLAAVRCYADERFASLTGCAQRHPEPRAAVQAMLAVIADVAGGSRGCLFVNAVTELAPGDADLLALAQAHTARVGALMTAAVARLPGLADGAEAAQRAGAVLALALGITMLRKTGLPGPQLKALLMQADHLLR